MAAGFPVRDGENAERFGFGIVTCSHMRLPAVILAYTPSSGSLMLRGLFSYPATTSCTPAWTTALSVVTSYPMEFTVKQYILNLSDME
ncbi:MAG: hypothetical protein ABIG45_01310 [Bacillota bacterium]